MSKSVWRVLILLSAGAVLATEPLNHQLVNNQTCNSYLLPSSTPPQTCALGNEHILSAIKKNGREWSVMSSQLQSLVQNMPRIATLRAPGLCGEHSRAVHHAARNLDLWALRMHDSNAKITSGILNGNVNQLGDFDQCLGINHETGAGESISGQYCLAYFEVSMKNANLNPRLAKVLELAQSYNVIVSNVTDPGHRIPRYSSTNWGTCVPASCSASDVEQGLREMTSLVNVPEFKVRVTVNQQMCYVKQPFSPDIATILCIVLFTSLIGLVITATILDTPVNESQVQHTQQSRLRSCIMAFSLRSTLRQLMSFEAPSDDISSVHGVRFLNAFGLIICHKSMALFFDPYINRTAMSERLSMPWTVLGRTAMIYTDPFVLISGMLVAYSLIKELDRQKGKINLKSKYVARFLRILPNFVAVVLFCTYIMQLMGSGPQWNLVVKHYSDMCKKYMWRNFLFIHNFYGFETMCLTHTHQLGIDMQLYLFSPLAVYMMWRWPRLGIAILSSIAALSTWMRYIVAYKNQLSCIVYFGMSVREMFEVTNISYILPTHRATVYIFGLFLGYFMRRHPEGINSSKIARGICWVLLVFCSWYPWLGQYPKSSMQFKYDVNDAALYNAFYPIVWGIFVMCFILLGHQNRGGLLGEFLRWKGFLVFTRLAYAVYLTQFPIFFYNVGTKRHATYSTIFDLVNVTEIGIVLIASIILTLLVDLPFQQIKKIISNKKSVQINDTSLQNVPKLQELTEDKICEDEAPVRCLRSSISHSTKNNLVPNITIRRVNSTNG